jgi:valyl-tRNA synthetase
VLLRLFAPVLPYITDEVWSWVFASETGHASVHAAPWPTAAEFAEVSAPADAASFDLAVSCLTSINKAKSDGGVSAGRVVEKLTLVAHPDTLTRLQAVVADVVGAARCQSHALQADSALDPSVLIVRDAVFAEKV